MSTAALVGDVAESTRLPLLTASRLKVARSCRRQHHLQFDLGYRAAVEPEVTRFGSLAHVGLEWWWRGAQSGVTGDALLETALAPMRASAKPETDAFELVRAEVLLTGYHLRWEADLVHYEVLAVEAQFECDLVNPLTGSASRTWRLGGKIDVVVRDRRDGKVLVVEHKTSSEDVSQGSEYWRRLRMDGQVSVYYEGARALGYDVAGCLYDVLSKPGIRPGSVPLVDDQGVKIVLDAAGQRVKTKDGKKWRETGDSAQGYVLQVRDETPEEFRQRLAETVGKDPDRHFARGDVVRLEQEMKDALLDVWQLGQELRQAELAKRHPRNPDACTKWGRLCPFFDVCTSQAPDEVLNDPARFRRSDLVHPELADAPVEH